MEPTSHCPGCTYIHLLHTAGVLLVVLPIVAGTRLVHSRLDWSGVTTVARVTAAVTIGVPILVAGAIMIQEPRLLAEDFLVLFSTIVGLFLWVSWPLALGSVALARVTNEPLGTIVRQTVYGWAVVCGSMSLLLLTRFLVVPSGNIFAYRRPGGVPVWIADQRFVVPHESLFPAYVLLLGVIGVLGAVTGYALGRLWRGTLS